MRVTSPAAGSGSSCPLSVRRYWRAQAPDPPPLTPAAGWTVPSAIQIAVKGALTGPYSTCSDGAPRPRPAGRICHHAVDPHAQRIVQLSTSTLSVYIIPAVLASAPIQPWAHGPPAPAEIPRNTNPTYG